MLFFIGWSGQFKPANFIIDWLNQITSQPGGGQYICTWRINEPPTLVLSCLLKYTDVSVFWSDIGAKRGFLPWQFPEFLVNTVQAKKHSCFSQPSESVCGHKADGRLSEKVGGKCRTLKSKLHSLIGNFSLTFENVYGWIKWKLYFF